MNYWINENKKEIFINEWLIQICIERKLNGISNGFNWIGQRLVQNFHKKEISLYPKSWYCLAKSSQLWWYGSAQIDPFYRLIQWYFFKLYFFKLLYPDHLESQCQCNLMVLLTAANHNQSTCKEQNRTTAIQFNL